MNKIIDFQIPLSYDEIIPLILFFNLRTKMEWFKVLPTLVLGLVASIASIYCQSNISQVDSWEQEQMDASTKPVIFAWIEKPPYATSPGNGSQNREVRGMIFDALMTRSEEYSCWDDYAQRRYLKVNHEFEMIDLLRQNKAHVAFPIFEQTPNRQYREFPFFKLDDYPGTEYITKMDDDRVLNVVLNSVLKSWPLFAVTMVLTAIAGVIMWCLVSNLFCNGNNILWDLIARDK